MFPATTQKTSEVPKKPPFEVPLAVESKKSLTDFDPKSKSVESTSRPTGGAGETVTKRSVKKCPKFEEEKSGKKVNSAVMDRVPKKNAQRAKGSTSLNKTMEKTNAEPTEKKKPPAEPTEKKKPPAEIPEKPEEPEKTATDGKKIPRNSSKTKTTKKTTKKDSKIPRTPQSWMNAKVNDQNEEVKPQEPPPPCEEVPEVPAEEIRTVDGPFSSCSFFEKIQQGVKAYFSSRNSFTPGEKNKKEGGSQTRPRVAKGVKEDATKRKPGFVFKNKISDSFHERLRVNSSLGGDSSNFSRAKSVKIFQKLKRKKLYRPKKHCVRIQIPRKGYFYRSTIQFKAPSSREFRRVDPIGVPKNEPKVQISGLASSGSKKPHLPNKKRLKKKKGAPNVFKRPDEMANCRFAEKLAEWERQKSRMECCVSERESVVGDSFETLANCLNSTLNQDLIYDLEITPVNKMDTVFAYNTTAITETPIQITSYYTPEANWGTEERLDPFNLTATLMDGVDLHSELQNYLKAFDSKYNFQNPNEFDEINDNISTFESATSIPDMPVMLENDASTASENCVMTTCSQTDIRKIKSAYDSRPSSSLIRTFGRTSFEKLQQDDESRTRLSMNSTDSYEKLFPLTSFNSDSKQKNKSNVLYENIVYSLSDESVPLKSDTNQSRTTSTAQLTFSESCSSEIIFLNADSQWSPTLQDLTEIYDSVLKQHQKISRNSRSAVNNFTSAHLISFLNKKLEEKQFKGDLIKLSRDFSRNYTPTNQWKPCKGNNSVKGYVSKFQELLQSPLSIKQITQLNKIISALQDYPEKNRQRVQESPTPVNLKKVKQTFKKQRPRKPKKLDSKPKQIPKEKVHKVKLSSPKELDHLLKTSFNSEEVVCIYPKLNDVKNKVLVTVQLHGDQVLVNGLTYFDSESVLSNRKKLNGTSELIIENVTKDRVTGFWYKKTKSSKLREQIHSKPKITPEKKPVKVKPIKKSTKPKKSPNTTEKLQQRQENELESFLQFHYDQVLLRAQHPIDAIIESSESKLSGLVENAQDKTTEQPKSEIDSNMLKEVLNGTLAENVLQNNFFRNIHWMEEEKTETFLTRAKSSMISPQTKRQTPEQKKKLAEASRSMVNLKNKNDRNVLPRPRTAFMCFPSIHKVQKSWKNEKSVGYSVSPPKTPNKPELSTTTTPSHNVLYLNSEVIPECCSIELLFFEDNPPTSSKVSVLKKEPSEPASLPSGQGATDSPIVLLPHNTAMADISFPSMIIRSDSYLRCIQRPGVSKNELESLFKSNSDMKFYPGKLTDSRAERKPFVTFVLTPDQKEVAELSENQIQVVNKTRGVPLAEMEKEMEILSDETTNEVPLDSIEKFISELSKCRARVAMQKVKNRHLRTKPETKPKPVRTQSKPPKSTLQKKAFGQMSQIFHSFSPKPLLKPKSPMAHLKVPIKKPSGKVFKKSQSRIVKIAKKPVKKCERSKQKAKRVKKEPEVKKISKIDVPKVERKKPEKVDHSDISFEVIEALKTAIAKTEDFPNKREIIAAIGKAFDKPEKTPDSHKKLKVFKIKILCNEHKCLKESKDAGIVTEEIPQGNTKPSPSSPTLESIFQAPVEVALLDSLIMKERNGEGEGHDLEKKNSTYFDALERTFRDDEAGEEMDGILKVQTGKKNEQLLKDAEEPEEVILQKISELLKEEDISYALGLLDVFLNREESSPAKNSAKLKKLLLLIENKCKTLMIKIERNAWLKVLSLLEEVSRLLECEDAESKKNRIQTAKDFLEKIQRLNVSRLVDLQNICCSLSSKNVFERIRDSLKLLREKFSLRRCELKSINSDCPLKIDSTVNLPAIKKACENKIELKGSKKKIEIECEAVPPEIQDVKDKVTEKMKAIKKAFENFEVAESSKGKKEWWMRKDSRSSFDGFSRDQCSAYADFMQCLMKVWDTRMSFNSFSKECYC